jgi:opacity protein-like surface antigen
MARMTIFSARLILALALALCLGGRTAHAQATPVTNWIPGGLIGFGGNSTAVPNSNIFGSLPSFDGSGGGASNTRYNFSNGLFLGSEAGSVGLSMNGINQVGAFSNFPSLSYQGVQVGYDFKSAGSLPIKVYAGFDTLNYNTGIGNPFTSFSSTPNTLSGYSARAGVEFQPTSNLSLSVGVGFTQQPGAYR